MQPSTPDALKKWRNQEAAAWAKAKSRDDPDIWKKINAYIHHGEYEAEMSTKLLEAQARFLEAM